MLFDDIDLAGYAEDDHCHILREGELLTKDIKLESAYSYQNINYDYQVGDNMILIRCKTSIHIGIDFLSLPFTLDSCRKIIRWFSISFENNPISFIVDVDGLFFMSGGKIISLSFSSSCVLVLPDNKRHYLDNNGKFKKINYIFDNCFTEVKN